MKQSITKRADQFILRLPDGMRDRIKLMATLNERSMNAEMIFHLKQALAAGTYDEKDRQGGNPDGLKQS